MRVFVAGGAGFIGSHFVRGVLADEYPALAGADVTVFDKLTYAGNLQNLAAAQDDSRFRFVRGDIAELEQVSAVLPGHDLVLNFAAASHVDRSLTGATDFVHTNVLGAQQLYEACVRVGVPRVVHVSTDEVYGSITTGSWTEQSALEPNSLYSATKAGADLIVRAYAVAGLDVRTTRCSNNYGPFQHLEKLIPRFVTRLLDGRTVPLYGNGRNVRDWLHVDDHCRAVAIVAEHGVVGGVYNVGGGHELSNRDLTALLLQATGRDWDSVQQVPDPRGPAHDLRYALDFAAVAALGYRPQIEFADGLADTVEWYRENREWWEPMLSGSDPERPPRRP